MSTNLRRAMIVIAVLGTALAAYLTYVHYSGTRPACTLGSACVKVQTSVWSKVDGVPVALMGLIGYVLIFFSLVAPDREETRMATVGLTLFGVCFSGYLTYRELFTIHLICEECATSAVLLALLFIGAVWRFLITSDLPPLPAADGDGDDTEAPVSPAGRRSPSAAGRA